MKNIRQWISKTVNAHESTVGLLFGAPVVAGNFLTVRLVKPKSSRIFVQFVTDDAGDTFVRERTREWKTVFGRSGNVGVTVNLSRRVRTDETVVVEVFEEEEIETVKLIELRDKNGRLVSFGTKEPTDEHCPQCGKVLDNECTGYGLAYGGGVGMYQFCQNNDCNWFWKHLDREGESDVGAVEKLPRA